MITTFSLTARAHRTHSPQKKFQSRSSLELVYLAVKDIFRFYPNIAVIGRTTVSTQVSVGTRDPRQIEASQQIIPTVYHVGGGRRIGGGRNAGVCELCQNKGAGRPTTLFTP